MRIKLLFLLIPVLLILNITYFYGQWVYQQVPSNVTDYGTIEFPNNQIGIVGGAFVQQNAFGRGAYTTNGGSNWFVSQLPDSTRVMVEINFVNLITGYCAGAYNVDTSNRQINLIKYDKRTFQAIEARQNSFQEDYKGLFLRTTNSGQSWNTYGVLPSNVYYLLGLHFVNSTTAFAIASYDYYAYVNCGVIKTTNAGLNWIVSPMPEIINDLEDIYFTDVNTGYSVGHDVVNDTARGVILKTTNSGLSWTRQIFMEADNFSGIHFSNPSIGLAIGSSSIFPWFGSYLYRTTNSGLNWTNIYNFDEKFFYGLRFVTGTGIALLYGYEFLSFSINIFLARTTDYGSSWTESLLNDSTMLLFDSELLDQNNWYVAGADLIDTFSIGPAVILHTTNGGAIGISPVSSEIPERFALHQNYPNPFNPVTRIRFDVPSLVRRGAGVVVLEVFDILGREVAALVNGQLLPGTYETDWDASNFAGGVYFYKLIAGDFSETRKMILVK